MTKVMTPRQKDVYDYLCRYEQRNGRMPSYREIGQGLRLASPRSVSLHLQGLVKAEMIRIQPGKHRAIELLHTNDENEVPVYGKVAAGLPLDISANVDRMVSIPDDLFRIRPDFLLEISGDSMIDIGIYEGDLAAIKRVRSAQSGQIVVAMVNTDEMSREEHKECGLSNTGITLKRLSISGNKVLLKSENRERNYAPLVVRPDRVRIEGRFVGLVRGG